MANGRSIPYWIEFGVKDDKLRQQMSKWNWEEIIGIKDFGQHFKKAAGEASDSIEHTLAGTNIDWDKVLNSGAFKSAVDKIVKDANRQMRAENLGSDEVQKVTEFVTELGRAMKEVGTSIDTAGFARSVAAFAKAVEPLGGQIEKLALAFDNVFKNGAAGIDNMAKSSEKVVSVMGKIESATKRTGGAQATLDKLTKRFKELENFKLPDVSSLSLDALEKQMEELEDDWDRLEEKFNGKSKNSSEYQLERGKLLKRQLHLYNAANAKDPGYFGKGVTKDIETQIQNIVKKFEAAMEKMQKQLDSDTFAQSISKQLSDVNIKLSLDEKSKTEFKGKLNDFINDLNKSDIAAARVKLDLAFSPFEGDDIKTAVNVDNIKSAIQDTINEIDKEMEKLEAEQQKYEKRSNPTEAGKYNKLDNRIKELKELKKTNQYLLDNSDDPNVQRALKSTLNSFNAIQRVIESKQGTILEKTHQWRQKMADAMQMDKNDVNIQLGFDKGLEASLDVLYNEVHRYFEENQIELHINKDAFIQEIKDAVASGGVSVGTIGGGGTSAVGGPVSFDPASLASVLATVVKGLATGDFTPVDITPKQKASDTGSESKKQKVVYLDPENPYIQGKANALKELAKYAQETGAPAAKVREFIDAKGTVYKDKKPIKLFDSKSLVDGTMMDLTDALSQLVERGGATLLDEFDNLIGGTKNKLLSDFRGELSDLLYTQNVGQVSIDEDTRRRLSIDVFKDYAKKSQLTAGVQGIIKTDSKNWKTPEISEIDKLIDLASEQKIVSRYITQYDEFGNVIDKQAVYLADELQTFKQSLLNIGDLTDENNKEQLMQAIASFKSSIQNTYIDLQNYIHAFEMDVDVKGYKKPYRVRGNPSAARVMNAIEGDYANISDVKMYKTPSTSTLGVSRQERMLMRGYGNMDNLIVPYPDRTDILYRDRSVQDWALSEDTLQSWTDENAASERMAKEEENAAERRKKSAELESKRAEKKKKINAEITTIKGKIKATEAEIEANQSRIDELDGDSKALKDAKKRLNKKLDAKDAAKKAFDDVVAQYEPWIDYMGNMPITVQDEISELLYDAELQKYYTKRKNAKTEGERNKYDGLIKQIYAKMSRETDTDKRAFNEDLRKYLSEDGAAIKPYQRAQKAYDKTLSEDDVQKLLELEALEEKNAQLEQENVSLMESIDDLKAQRDKSVSTKDALSAKYQKNKATEIDGLLKQAEKLQQEVDKSRVEAEKLDTFVRQTMDGEEYKKQKPTYDIDYTAEDRDVVDKRLRAQQRHLYLKSVIDGTHKPDDKVPDNVTKDMTKAAESLLAAKDVLRFLSKDFGLDQFTSDQDLAAEIKARLDRTSGKNILAPIVEEFYNKILTDGLEAANKWRQDVLSNATQDKEQQLGALKSFAQQDEDLISTLKPEVENANNNLKAIFKERVRAWADSIKSKIDDFKNNKNLSAEDKALLVKEIESMFGLIDQAKSKYITNFTSGEHYVELSELQRQMDSGELSKEEYSGRVRALNQENEQRLFDELLVDNEELMAQRSEYIYSVYRDANIRTHTADRNQTYGRLNNSLSERESLLLTRQAELLGDIEDANKAGRSDDGLVAELNGINNELARYDQYHRQIAASDTMSLFYDDAETLTAYKNGLAEIIELEQKAQLAKAQGESQDELASRYGTIDNKSRDLDNMIYTKLSGKRDGLLSQIKQNTDEAHRLDGIIADLEQNGGDAATIKDYKAQRRSLATSTQDSVALLEAVNKELIQLEINKRRAEETKIGKLLYKADVITVQTYNTELKKTIELEQQLALAEARGENTADIKESLRRQKQSSANKINRLNESRIATEAANSPRVQALDYLSKTDKAYSIAQEQRYTAKRRKERLQRQLDDIENDEKYSTSWQYRKQQEVVKDRFVNEYVASNDYQADREAGFKKVEDAFMAKLVEVFGDGDEAKEVRDRVFYEFIKNQHGKKSDHLDPAKFKETYGNIVSNGDYIDEMRKSLEEEYTNSQEYKDFVAERQRILQNQLRGTGSKLGQAYDDIDAGRISEDAELQKKLDAVDEATTSYIEDVKQMTESNPLLKEEIDKLLVGVDIKDQKHYESIVEKARGRLITEAQNMVIDTKKAEAYKHYGAIPDDVSKPFLDQYNASLQNAVTNYIRNYFDHWVQTAFTDEDFAKMGGGGNAEELTSYFKHLLEENVYNLVSNYAESLHVENGVLNGVNIRDEAKKAISSSLSILEQMEKDIEIDIAHIEEQRKAAMKDGGVGYKEVADAEVLKNQAIIAGKLEMATQKRAELLEQIAILEQEGDQSKEVERLNAELKKTEESIGRLQVLHDSRDTLIDLQHQALQDKKAAEKWDPEKQRLYYLNKIEVAESKMADADDVTKKELEHRIANWTGQLERIDGIIAQREAEAAEAERSQVKNAIKELFGGGIGGGTIDGTGLATEDTLQQILQAITGGQVVAQDPDVAAKRARIAEIDRELGLSDKKVRDGGVSKTTKSSTKDDPDYIINAREFAKKELASIKSQDELSVIANKLVDDIGEAKEGTKEAIELQLKLQKVVNRSGTLYKAASGKKSYTAEKIGELLGIDKAVSLRLSEDNARKAVEQGFVESEKQLENEKKKTAETAKQVENKQKETSTQPAVDKNKIEIAAGTNVNDLKHYQKDAYAKYIGKNVGSYKTSDAVFSNQESVQAKVAELRGIMDTSAQDSEEYLKAMVEMSRLISAWRNVVKKTNPEVKDNAKWQEYLTSGDGKLFDNAEDVPLGGITSRSKVTLKQTALNLGTKMSADAANALAVAQQTAYAKEREAVAEEKISEEKKEQKAADTTSGTGVAPNKDREASLLAEKRRLEEELKDAKTVETSDDGIVGVLKLILEAVDSIRTNGVPKGGSTSHGSSSGRATGQSKTFSTTEMDAVERQRAQMMATFGDNFFDRQDIQAVKEYDAAYQQLVKDYKAGNKEQQESLRLSAMRLRAQGKELSKSLVEAEHLEQLVDSSGTYKGMPLSGIRQLSADEVNNLDASMKSYLQSLKLGNVENVKFDNVHKRLTGTLRTSNKTVADLEMKYNEATQSLYLYNKQERESLTGLPAFIKGFKGKIGSILQYTASITSIYRIIGTLRQGLQYVREIDSALTELRKVTDETEESYERFLNTAAKTASKVGSTIKEVVSSTADWARIGYNLEEAATLAESTAVLLNVSEFKSIDEATSALTSTLQAFGYTAEQSMSVVDVMNEVGNNFAVSSDGIATALQDSASSLMAANNSYEQAVALIAAANRVVQDPNSVGAALRTISLRLRGTSVKGLEEAGEDTAGAVTSKSKLRGKVKSLSGVDILTDTGAYKDTYTILLEISKVWKDMSDIDQAALLEIIAGKTRSNTAAAILSNTKDLEAAYDSAMNAEGSAWAENEKYLDSIQGRIDLFNNAMQTMWNNAINDDFVKTIVDVGTQLVKWVDQLGLIKTLFIAIGTFAIKKYFKGDLFGGLFGDKTQDIGKMKQTLEALRKARDDAAAALASSPNSKSRQNKFNLAQSALDGYEKSVLPQIQEYDVLNEKLKTAQANLDKYQKRLNNYQGTNQKTIKSYQSNVAKAQQEVNNLELELRRVEVQAKTTGNAGMTASQKIKAGFKTAGKAVWQFGKEVLASMATMYVITTVFELLTKLGHMLEDMVDGWVTTPEEAQDEFEKLNDELSNVQSELSGLNAELETTQDRIDELLAKSALSFTEQEELDRLRTENDELERKIRLTKTLAESKQRGVNAAAVTATDKYLSGTSFGNDQTRSEKQEEAKSTGKTIGQAVGLVGTAIALAALAASGIFTGGTTTALAITAAGGLLGGAAGGAIGSAGAGAKYDSEQSVGEAMDDMIAQRAKLQKAQGDALADEDAEAYNEATEALNTYDAQMSKHIEQIQANYNAMDWSTATTEQKKKMIEYADWLDKYSISMGADGAKSSAIERIFGGAEASQELKNIDKQIKETIKSGGEVDFYEMFNSASLSDTKQRLAEIGISITDLKYYYLDWKETEAEVEGSTYDAAKAVGALSSSISSLKDAFSEFQENGLVTADTLTNLYDTFGSLGDVWDNYVDVMATGTASTNEAKNATVELLEALMNKGLANGPIKDMKEYLALIGQLQNLGMSNANGYVDALQKTSMVSSISKDIVNQEKELAELDKKKKSGEITEEEYNEKKANLQKSKTDFIKQYEEEYGIDLSDEEESVLLEKAITAEKAKQNVEAARTQATAREKAVKNQEGVKEHFNDVVDLYNGLKSAYDAGNVDEYEQYLNKLNNLGIDTTQISYSLDAGTSGEDWARSMGIEDGASIEIPAEVNVDDAEQQAKDAQDAYQQALDDLGLTIQIELYESGQAVDDIQSLFDTLASAQKEYNEEGYFSVDTMQSLLELEPKYLDLLYDENGKLNLNKDALFEVAKARIIGLGIKQKESLVNTALALSEDGSTEALLQHISVTEQAVESNDAYIASTMKTIRTNLERRKSEGDINIDVDSFMSGLNSQLNAIDKTTNIALSNLKNSLSSSGNTAKDDASDKFQKAMSYWENRIGAEQSRFEQVQNEADLMEKQGKIAGEEYYQEQIDSEERRLALLQQQKAEAQKYLGQFKEGSDEWWDVANTLNDIESEIDDVTSSIQDLTDAMADVDWKVFQEAHKRYGDIHDDLDTMRTLLSPNGEEDWFDDEGMWTDNGTAYLATYISDLQYYEGELADVNKKLNEDYNLPYAGNEEYYKNLGIDSEQELYDKRRELIDQQSDIRKSMSDTQQSVVDMYEAQIDAVEEWANEATEAYQDYIDVVKEALDAERDLYEFKKDIEKQTKDIGALERRIASLAGSDNAADIAERRKLEAELAEAREGLNDSYYNHAKDAQSKALEDEATAYEESMNKFIEGLRESLNTATEDMNLFMQGVIASVTSNAPAIVEEYGKLDFALSDAIINPWTEAADAVKDFGGADGLGIMNQWIAEGGVFPSFKSDATTALTEPWAEGGKAIEGFEEIVRLEMAEVVQTIRTNVESATTELNSIKSLYADINDTTIKTPSGTNPGGNKDYEDYEDDDETKQPKMVRSGMTSPDDVVELGSVLTGYVEENGVKKVAAYYKVKGRNNTYVKSGSFGQSGSIYEGTYCYAPKYAKGTLGTKKSGLAITDESWIGEEITLAAGKNGQLQYLRKGSAVMPADISANLVEWGKLNPNMMNMGGVPNVNMVSNAINKPEFNMSFDSLVHVDHCDEGTLKDLEKMVDVKINQFSKQMNYAIKKIGGR